MPTTLLLCELRADRARTPADTETPVILSRLNVLLRHARTAGWGVAYVGLRRREVRSGPIPGLEPLPSEAVFSAEEGAFDPRPLIDTLTVDGRPLALAGFGFREIMAPILDCCARERRPVILVEDAVAFGLGREFALRSLARDRVRIVTSEALLAGVNAQVVRITDYRKP